MANIWLVDDDEEMIRAVQLMLKLLGHESRFFLGARQAAKTLLTGECPDLLMLDINMPEVTGVDLLEFLRRRKEWKHLPVVMLSTEAADVMVDKTLMLGADAYITKPVTIEELDAAVKKAIAAHGKVQNQR